MRRMRLAAVLATVPLFVTGCGGTDDAIRRVALAAEETRAGDTARIATEVTIKATSSAEGQASQSMDMAMTGEGVFDFAAHRGRLSLLLSSVPGVPPGTTMESIFDGSFLYVQNVMTQQWLRFDVEAVTEAVGQDLLAQQSSGNDPTAALQLLDAAQSAEKIGVEAVRDAVTTHYRVTVDVQQAAGDGGEGGNRFLRRMLESLGSVQLPLDVWLDDDNRIRKLAFESERHTSKESVTMRVSAVYEYYDFGTEVDVVLPPADQVQDITEQMLEGTAKAGS